MQSRTQGPIFAPRPAEIRPWVRRLGKILPEVMTVYWPRPNAEVRAVRIDGNIFPSTERLCLENNWFISLFIYILTFSSGFSLFIRVVLACEVRSLRFWTGVNQNSSFHRIPDLGGIKNDMLLFVCFFLLQNGVYVDYTTFDSESWLWQEKYRHNMGCKWGKNGFISS